ncbi:MAG TPA: precorrin-2 C(20)-methyltransferase [Leptolyngbyaceae cyanobacterium M33_DOE_097]|uniref:Precorrin-2 C(20)-methyltransferase n=1 Tax=Oscillatoriales cyanobacterium SpSt-418 TaxID=2282169 RepID=A0A7C3PIQ9_9CYAN|nr:precorrin-2 C(20)-methyltransferase [Leptolyngbyaceae cyanobacterium M33_DOE_097]
MTLGTLYGISVGPGDPELLTIKGLRRLQQASVVAFPAGLHGKPGFAQRIIASHLQPEQLLLPLEFPFVLEMEVLSQAWQVAAKAVWAYLSQGQDVAFACEGDVSFYSTFTYLAQTLQTLYPEAQVEAVPGVCSPLAAASMAGLPITVRQEKLVVLPALYAIAELETAVQWAEVVVLMKVSSVYSQVWQVLKQHNLLTSSFVVEWATNPQQVIHRDLQDKPDLQLPYFSLLIVQKSG